MTDTSNTTITIELNGESHQATSGLTVRALVKAVSVDGDNADLTALATTTILRPSHRRTRTTRHLPTPT